MKQKSIIITVLISALALLSCTQKQQEPTAGKGIGEIYVTAAPGSRSVLVKLDGLWRVRPLQEWLHTDVNGREGEGAFTFYFDSNESDFVNFKPVRRGSIVIESLTTMVADTLWVRQQGLPDGKEYDSHITASYIEIPEGQISSLSVLYANLKGASAAAITSWKASVGADVNCIISDEGLSIDGANVIQTGTLAAPEAVFAKAGTLNLALSDFGETPAAQDSYYKLAVELLSQSYDSPQAEENWLVGGSFYYKSVMEIGYASTPEWYPSNPSDQEFQADRFVQSSNLTDCVWMSRRDYTPTWTSSGKSWRADYLYASHSVWNATTLVRVLDDVPAGASHKAFLINIKF